MSPSAFIPFCEFGGNMTAMGIKIDQFELPICYSFQEKIFNDQLCYEVDLADKNNPSKELKLGFNFLMDYNEDRQIDFETIRFSSDFDLASTITKLDDYQHAFLYLDSIGRQRSKIK